jgi:hypothetical protein
MEAKMIKVFRGLTLSALGVLAIASTASAESRGYSAVLCTPASSTDAGNLLFTTMGVETTNLSGATVFCGGVTRVAANVRRIEATVYDRNPDADVCCSMLVMNADGFGVASGSRCSSGSGGPSQRLSVTLPGNSASSVILACTIPPASPDGASRVTSYRVFTN